jgi:hypothetical protein
MNKSKRIIIFVLFLCGILHCEPKQLTNFVHILDALKTGYKVTAVTDYKKCRLVSDGKEQNSPERIGGIEILPFDYYAAGTITKKAFISTSETVMIYLAGFNGYLYNYVKLRVYDDNTVEITVRYLTIDKLEVQSDEMYYGEINDGVNDKGVCFYSN